MLGGDGGDRGGALVVIAGIEADGFDAGLFGECLGGGDVPRITGDDVPPGFLQRDADRRSDSASAASN